MPAQDRQRHMHDQIAIGIVFRHWLTVWARSIAKPDDIPHELGADDRHLAIARLFGFTSEIEICCYGRHRCSPMCSHNRFVISRLRGGPRPPFRPHITCHLISSRSVATFSTSIGSECETDGSGWTFTS